MKGIRLPGKGMSLKEFAVGMKDEVTKDDVTDLAAAVTYYGVLALFPFVLFMVALASVVITPDQAQGIVDQLAQVAPGPVTQILGDRIRQLAQGQNVGLVGLGALGALWAASGAVLALMRALNVTYGVKEGRPFWKVRALGLLMTLVAGVLAIAAGLTIIAAEPVAAAVGGPVGTAILWLRLPVAGLVMMFLWALLYYALPDVEQDFKFITPGSVIGVVVWVLASWAFGKYVSHFGSYDKTYGSIAGVIVLLLWMWLSALVLLVGAEVNALIEHRSPEGKREGAKRLADSGTTPVDVAVPGAPREPAPRDRPRRAGALAAAAAFVAGILVARKHA